MAQVEIAMKYEAIIKALRASYSGHAPDTQVIEAAADSIEELQTQVETLRTEHEHTEREADRLIDKMAALRTELRQKSKENNILRSELRRMFRLYVAAEMRADTGESTEEVDDAYILRSQSIGAGDRHRTEDNPEH